MFDRDNSTAVDAYNMLRCLQLYNVTAAFGVSISDQGVLLLNFDATMITYDQMVNSTKRCFARYGHGISLVTSPLIDYEGSYRYLGSATAVLNARSTNMLSNVRRAIKLSDK